MTVESTDTIKPGTEVWVRHPRLWQLARWSNAPCAREHPAGWVQALVSNVHRGEVEVEVYSAGHGVEGGYGWASCFTLSPEAGEARIVGAEGFLEPCATEFSADEFGRDISSIRVCQAKQLMNGYEPDNILVWEGWATLDVEGKSVDNTWSAVSLGGGFTDGPLACGTFERDDGRWEWHVGERSGVEESIGKAYGHLPAMVTDPDFFRRYPSRYTLTYEDGEVVVVHLYSGLSEDDHLDVQPRYLA